jgi:hypothetical protein
VLCARRKSDPLRGGFIGIEPPIPATCHADDWNDGIGVGLVVEFSIPRELRPPQRVNSEAV